VAQFGTLIHGNLVYLRHWESKNFTPLAKKIIEEKISKIELRIDDDDFLVEKVELTGEVINKILFLGNIIIYLRIY